MMFLAKYQHPGEPEQSRLYFSPELFHQDTFSPDCELLDLIDFTTSGSTYAERKASAEAVAVSWSNGSFPGLTWGDLADIGAWFERIAARYGLRREFAENGII